MPLLIALLADFSTLRLHRLSEFAKNSLRPSGKKIIEKRMSTHRFDFQHACQVHACAGGKRELLTRLEGMSVATIELAPGGVREPHWHPNASEMTYCLAGKALVTIFAPNNVRHSFTLEKGEVVFFPQGYLHHLENIHDGPSKFLVCFNHDLPEDLNISSTLQGMSPHVVAATFGVQESLVTPLFTSKEAFFALKKERKFHDVGVLPSPFKMNLEKIQPQLVGTGGYAKIANIHSLKVCEGFSLFSLVINQQGIREPHWHPNAVELNYVISGRAKVTIVSPGGTKEQFTLGVHEGSYIPRGYFHAIENIGDKDLHMAVYFNNSEPSDIGLSGAFSAYSQEVLAATFGVESSVFTHIPKILEDRLIVK